MLRLDKILSTAGKGTRSEVNKYIKRGLVSVNGEIVKDSSKKVDENTAIILLDGEPVSYKEHFYIMLNKPQDCVCATVDNFQKTVLDLIDDPLIKSKVKPAGRLDIDTEGFVFLTSDGDLNHQITGPKHHIIKTYYAEVKNKLDDSLIEIFKNGVIIDNDYKTKPANLNIISENSCYLEISEGKYHQVKQMFLAVDNEVTYLKRTKIGMLELDSTLKLSEYRELTNEELKLLTKGRNDIGN